ncbi:MAG: GxxExxY protein [Terriglobales bacterium]|jgi:GxxExxY protein
MDEDLNGATLKHEALTSRIIGVFYSVYNELGYGFLESVYEEALFIALTEHGLEVKQQHPVPVWFHGRRIGDFKADLLVENLIVLELKAARTLDSSHEAQWLHYLKSTEFELGLLFNFGLRPAFRRLLFDNERKRIREYPWQSVAEMGS